MKLGNITQLFRPLQTPIDNIVSHHLYRWSYHKPWFLLIKTILFVMGVAGLVGDLTNLITGTVFNRILTAFGLIVPSALSFLEFAASYNQRFTTLEEVSETYDHVQPHADGWERIDLQVRTGKEPVFRSDAMDQFLRSGKPIALERDKLYEKNLRRRLRDKNRWSEVYLPFLQNNYRSAMYSGKQFYNEKKYGLSAPIDPAIPKAKIHKTCYFDTYLTNIIPGKRLINNSTQEIAADATEDDFLPYRTDAEGNRQLYSIGERITANEVGVTTILITANDQIRLWTQNRMSQCSSSLLVASGSGSADWNDCKAYLGEANGLRKAVIHGMERELWEESDGERAIHYKQFKSSVQTRITGYFRWLKKGGKSEFVGVSRLTEWGMIGNLAPEYSEVTGGSDLPAHTIAELIGTIDKELGENFVARRCGVSCSMALNALRSTCRDYCKTCPHWVNGACSAEKCPARPFQVLF